MQTIGEQKKKEINELMQTIRDQTASQDEMELVEVPVEQILTGKWNKKWK